MFALADYAPSVDSLTDLQLVLFKHLVEPRIPQYDAAVAAFDGQLIRIDGTFRVAARVRVHALSTGSGKTTPKIIYKKVGTALMVVVGLEGLILNNLDLVPAENNDAYEKCVLPVLTSRRELLGSLSAPAAFVTDTIKKHRHVLFKATDKVYPELQLAPLDEKDRLERVLMLQDILHRQWAFTKKSVTRTHPDFKMYESAVKEVFHQLRCRSKKEMQVPVPAADVAAETKTALLKCLADAGNANDGALCLQFLQKYQSRSMAALHVLTGEYVPRVVLKRLAVRLGHVRADLPKLFPDYGYQTSTEFLFHLQGVNDYYARTRSATGKCGDQTVVNELGRYTGPVKRGTGREKKTRRLGLGATQRARNLFVADEELRGITDNDLIPAAMEAIKDKSTLRGLLDHKEIPDIGTEEVLVEAVNKYLNAGIHHGQSGYDVALMRLQYQRLHWNAAVLRRVTSGDVARGRRTRVQAAAVWEVANTILVRPDGFGVFLSRSLPPAPERKSAADLVEAGHRLVSSGSGFTAEEMKTFFKACAKFNR